MANMISLPKTRAEMDAFIALLNDDETQMLEDAVTARSNIRQLAEAERVYGDLFIGEALAYARMSAVACCYALRASYPSLSLRAVVKVRNRCLGLLDARNAPPG